MFNKKEFFKKTSVIFQLSTLFVTAWIFCDWDLKTNHLWLKYHSSFDLYEIVLLIDKLLYDW